MVAWLGRITTLGALAIMLFGQPAIAQGDNAQSFSDAVNALKLQFGQKELDLPAPAPNDFEAQRQLAIIRAAIERFGSPEFPVDGNATFQTICAPLSEITSYYLLNGAKALSFLQNNQIVMQSSLQSLMISNSIKHQDAMTTLLSAATKCSALHMPFFERFWATLPLEERTPMRATGIAQLRKGAINMLIGFSISGVDPAMSLKNRREMIEALAKYAPDLANTLQREQRSTVLQSINQSAQSLVSTFPTEYASIILALKSDECNAICMIK